MAKALYGHLAHRDSTLVWENDRLRARVAQLEAEVERLTLELAPAVEPVVDTGTERVLLGAAAATG
jgi:cell division protein FtsB